MWNGPLFWWQIFDSEREYDSSSDMQGSTKISAQPNFVKHILKQSAWNF